MSGIVAAEYGPEDKQMGFVNLLKQFPSLLDKSQTPSAKARKKLSLEKLKEEYQFLTGNPINEAQLMKKINNMKTDVKRKSDLNKTGNKKLNLKPWETAFLDILEAKTNPSLSCIPGGISVGMTVTQAERSTSSAVVPLLPGPSTSQVVAKTNQDGNEIQSPGLPNPRKRRATVAEAILEKYETKETESLSITELQRLVLLQQLKLVKSKQDRLDKVVTSENEPYYFVETPDPDTQYAE